MWTREQKRLAYAALVAIVALVIYASYKATAPRAEGFILAKNLPAGAILEQDWVERARAQQAAYARDRAVAAETIAISRAHMTPAQAAYMAGFNGAA